MKQRRIDIGRILVFILILATVSIIFYPAYRDTVNQFLAQDTINLRDGSISFHKSCTKRDNGEIPKIKLGDRVGEIIYSIGELYVYEEVECTEFMKIARLKYGQYKPNMVFDISYDERGGYIGKAIIIAIHIDSADFITSKGITVGDTLQKVKSVYPLEMKDSLHSGNINMELFKHKKLNVDFLFVNDKLIWISMYKSSFDVYKQD